MELESWWIENWPIVLVFRLLFLVDSVIKYVQWLSHPEANAVLFLSCYQSLLLLGHLIRNGSERVVTSAREHLYDLRSLESYHFVGKTLSWSSFGLFTSAYLFPLDSEHVLVWRTFSSLKQLWLVVWDQLSCQSLVVVVCCRCDHLKRLCFKTLTKGFGRYTLTDLAVFIIQFFISPRHYYLVQYLISE